MGRSVRTVAVTSNIWDKEALAFELDVQKKRHYRHRSALFVMNDADQKFDEDDSDEDSEDTPSEYDLTMNFSGLDFQQKIKKVCAIVFIVLEVPSSSGIAKFVSLIINAVIILSVVSYILSTEISLRVGVESCPHPACDNDPILCPGSMICSDVARYQFIVIENICTYLFTIEYGLRLATCWAVSPRVAGLMPSDLDTSYRYPRGIAEPAEYSVLWTIARYALKFRSMVDLASFMPTYIGMALAYPDQNKFLYVLPLLRVVKVLRLMRLLSFLKNVDVARDLIFEALKQSALILSVFLFFVVVIIILFGCLIYLCEGGTYTVNSEYPRGAYLRMANTGRSLEATPFNSIATGMYWVISTGAGSGDLSATSTAGRAVACVLLMMGVLGLAVPLGVIGSELDRAYTKHFVRLMKISENKQAQLVKDAISSADLVMKRKPTKDGIVAPAVGECSKDDRTADTSTLGVLRKMRSRRNSSQHPGSAASSQKTELNDCSTPTQQLRQDTASFTGERRKSVGGKRSRENSYSRPLSISDVNASEQSRSLEGVRALVVAAKESVQKATEHLKALRELERELIIVMGDATSQCSPGLSCMSSPGLSSMSPPIGGRWSVEEDGPRSHKHISPRRTPSANSITSAIETRFSLKKKYPEFSRATSADEQDEVET